MQLAIYSAACAALTIMLGHSARPALGYTAENKPARGFGVFRWEKRKKGYGFLSQCNIFNQAGRAGAAA